MSAGPVTITQATPTVVLAVNPTTINYGGTAVASVTLSPANATGTVTVVDVGNGNQVVGQGAVSNGVATITISGLLTGNRTLRANYSGDTNYTAASSAFVTENVNRLTTTTSVAVNPVSSAYGTTVTLTATLNSTSATGNVAFNSGNTLLGTANVSNGVATLQVSTLAAGTYSVIATYNGDNIYLPSTSAAAPLTITKATTTPILTASSSTGTYGAPLQFGVTFGSAAPTGNVTFFNGSTPLGTTQVVTSPTGSAASAVFTSLTAGTHTISASYSGDGNFGAATSNSVTVVISVASSTTAVSLNPGSITFPGATTAIATVSPAGSGTVTFYDGSFALVPVASVANGVATASFGGLPPGTHAVTAVYSGDANVGGSVSAPQTLTVARYPTTATVTSDVAALMYGGTVNLTANLGVVAGTFPTGTVTFFDGSTTLFTAQVNALTATATGPYSALLPGTHHISAVYSGDANFAPVTVSAAQGPTLTVTATNSTTTLTSIPPQATPGASFTLTASVVATNPVTGQVAPTGSIVFSDSTGNLGIAPLVNGSATYTTSLIPLGSHGYTATYSGDSDYTTSAGTVSLIIKQLGSATAITANPTSGSYGGPTYSFTATMTIQGGGPPITTGSVQFTDVSTTPVTVLGTVAIPGTVNGIPIIGTLSGVSLTGGTHRIVATFSGDQTYVSSDTSAAPAVVVVSPAASTTTASASPSTTTPAGTVTLSSQTTSFAGGVTPTGTVSFSEPGTTPQVVPFAAAGESVTVSNLAVGTHTFTVTYSGDRNYAASTTTVQIVSNAIAQTITVTGVPAALTYGAAPFVISATSNSGLPVSVAFTGPATLLGSTFTVTGAGTITITATQAGDATHAAATPVVVSVAVAKAPLAVTTSSFSISPGAAIPTLTGSVSGVVNNDPITASFATTATSASAAGTYPITATLNDPANRVGNYSVTNPGGTLTIVANNQSITFPAIQTTATYGTAPIVLAATASSGLSITYTVSGPGAIVGSTLVITGAGSVTVTATQPGNGVYSVATPVAQAVSVAKAALTVVAANASRAFGAVNPAFTGTVTGVVGRTASRQRMRQQLR